MALFVGISLSLESIRAKNALLENENEKLRDFGKRKKRPRAGITVPNMCTHNLMIEDVYQAVQEAMSSALGH